MDSIRIVVLTKSSKFGRYCVAGISIDDGKWVRLVTDDENSHGAVTEKDLICENGTCVEVFDVIDVPILEECHELIQPENVLLDVSRYVTKLGRMTLDDVLSIHPAEIKSNILGNEYYYITEARVETVGYSLTMVEVNDLVIHQRNNPQGQPKTKTSFYYNRDYYENLSVTDDRFYNVDDGTRYEDAILIISIGTPYNNKYYKFVAAIYV